MVPADCKDNYPPSYAFFVGDYVIKEGQTAVKKCWSVSQAKSTINLNNPATFRGGIIFDAKVGNDFPSTRTITSTPESVTDQLRFPAPVITYSVRCDLQKTGEYIWAINQGGSDGKKITLQTSGIAGCRTASTKIVYQLILKNRVIIFPILIALGLIFCYFGNSLFKYTLAMIGFLTGFGLILGLIAIFMAPSSYGTAVFALILALLFGCLGAYIFYRFEKISLALSCK